VAFRRLIEIIRFDQKTEPALAATGATTLIDQGAVAIVAACDFDFGCRQRSSRTPRNPDSTCAGDPKLGAGHRPYAMRWPRLELSGRRR
jgi:hypothetical protein